MSPRELGEIFDAVESGIAQFKEGENWVKRRDAADVLGLGARDILLALRRGSTDADPDVALVSKQIVEAIKHDLGADLSSIELELASQRRTLGIHQTDSVSSSAPSGGDRSTDGASPQTIRKWLTALAEREKGTVEGEGARLAIQIPLQAGRSQKVFIETGQKDSSGEDVIVLYTLCGAPEAKMYGSALESNARLSHAAFALLKRGEEQTLILVSRRRLAGLSQSAFETDLLYIARKGDQAEGQLQAGDKY